MPGDYIYLNLLAYRGQGACVLPQMQICGLRLRLEENRKVGIGDFLQ
jgi:hypothetical protein